MLCSDPPPLPALFNYVRARTFVAKPIQQTAMARLPAIKHHLLLLLLLLLSHQNQAAADGFVGVDGTLFVTPEGGTVYFSGFNAYWLMLTAASGPAGRAKVLSAFRQASAHGLNLARTWAFSDGGDSPLQRVPGVYDERVFRGLDFVVAEARRHGVRLLLCLTNNFLDFGGKRQYVQWARDAGHNDLAVADDFFNSTVVKGYYKNHVKTVLTRVNSLTGVAYKDDPTILGWELMNEPRCDVDPTGRLVQSWVEEMAPYVKSIDSNHLVTVGLEGFYGDGKHESKDLNPWGIYYGTNFVDTHAAPGVDFATIHLYPDLWLWGCSADKQARFLTNWTRSHVQDTELYLGKPLLVTEYGKFLWESAAGNDNDNDKNNKTEQRNRFLRKVLDSIYDEAAAGGPLVGGAFWHLLDAGMDSFRDGYEIVLREDTRAATIIRNHSVQLAQLDGQDAEEILRRRRNRAAAPAPAPAPATASVHRKIHAGDSTTSSGWGRPTSDDGRLRGLLVRFIALFRQISSSIFL